MANLIVGISGGSGSGKSTLVRRLLQMLEGHSVALIEQDAYYRDRPDLTYEQRTRINYDHPASLDNELLLQHLRQLSEGKSVEKPVYDFTTHTRRAQTVHVEPADVLIVEGILIFENEELRSLMDLKLFVDTDSDVRLIRRLHRDMRERGRSLESVIQQYLTTVRPMHLQFVEPSKRYADVIIPEGGLNEAANEMIAARLRAILSEKRQREKAGEGAA